MSAKDVKFTPAIPPADPALDASALHSGYPPPEPSVQWHESPDARWLIAHARLAELPGLSETIQQRLWKAEKKRKAKATIKGHRLGSWPSNVRAYCTFVWGDKTGEDALDEWEGVGKGTITAIQEILTQFGIQPGMGFAVFDDWMRCLKPNTNIRIND